MVGPKRAITFFNSKPDYIQSAVEASLRRLKLDSIPLYYIHWPDPKVPLAKTFNKLQMLKELGKIKYLGCSNFSYSQNIFKNFQMSTNERNFDDWIWGKHSVFAALKSE